jgi:hypothetical protein
MSSNKLSVTSGNVTMPSNNAYNLGTGAFSLLALVKPTGTGTIVSRKSTAGGIGNGGWLLVIENNNVLKFATDDGTGYYQIKATASNLHDGYWHAIAAVRDASGTLSLYVDGYLLTSTVGTNRFTPLNINNSIELMVAGTSQAQEPCNQYSGDIMNVSLWNSALTQVQVIDAMVNPVNGGSTIGCWTFDGNYSDSSPTGNNGTANGSAIKTTELYMTMPFMMQRQSQTNWCWAADSTSVSIFYNPLSTWTQCTVVNATLNRTDCCTNPSSSSCNIYGYLNRALTTTGNYVSSSGVTSFSDCKTQMNTWRVLGTRTKWAGGGAHFVVISGISDPSGTETVTIRDSIYGTSTIPYTTFVSNYKGSGTWTHSYFTKP